MSPESVLNYNSTTPNVAYGALMRWVFSAMNSSGGVPAACIAAHPDDPALCIFAENVAPTLRTPTFALQSTYDLYQIPAIAGLKPSDVAAINAYGAVLKARLEAQFLGTSAAHGVFLDSCYHHVAEWREIVIDGVDNAQALQLFYESVGTPGARTTWEQGKPYPCAACCVRGQ